jgi:hypothetical protein
MTGIRHKTTSVAGPTWVNILLPIVGSLAIILIWIWEAQQALTPNDSGIGANSLIAIYLGALICFSDPFFRPMSTQKCLYAFLTGSVLAVFLIVSLDSGGAIENLLRQRTVESLGLSVSQRWEICLRFVIPLFLGLWFWRLSIEKTSSVRFLRPIRFEQVSRWSGLVLLAVALSLYTYSWLLDRTFWVDEAKVSLAIKQYSTLQFLIGEGDGQYFPDLYLFLIRYLVGITEYDKVILRLMPFICAVVSAMVWLHVFRLFIREKFNDIEGWNGFLLQSVPVVLYFSVYLTYYYSGELKPYTGDLLCAGLSVLFARKLGRSFSDANRIAIVAWFIMSSIPFFFSQSYILVAPALLSAIGIVYWKTIRNNFFLVSAALSFPTIGAVFSYYRDIRATQNAGLLDYWQYGMIGGGDFPEYLKSVFDRVFDLTVGWWVATDTVMLWWIPIVLFGLVCGGLFQGLIEVFRHQGAAAKSVLVVMPLGLLGVLVVGSMFGVFPIHGSTILSRICLFFYPFCILLVLGGLGLFLRMRSNLLRRVGWLSLNCLLFSLLFWNYPQAVNSAAHIVETMEGSYVGSEDWQDISASLGSIRCDKKLERENAIVLFEEHFLGILGAEPDLPGCDFVSFHAKPSKIINALDMTQTVYILTRDAVSVRNLLIRELPVVENKLNHVRRWALIDKYLLIGSSVKDG